MAKEYPNASFTGIDHRPLFKAKPPPNVTIEHGDIFATLPFNDNTFDFVFMRFLALEIPESKFEENLIPELVRVLKPNGYLEIMDFDVQVGNEGPVTQQLTSAGKQDLLFTMFIIVYCTVCYFLHSLHHYLSAFVSD